MRVGLTLALFLSQSIHASAVFRLVLVSLQATKPPNARDGTRHFDEFVNRMAQSRWFNWTVFFGKSVLYRSKRCSVTSPRSALVNLLDVSPPCSVRMSGFRRRKRTAACRP